MQHRAMKIRVLILQAGFLPSIFSHIIWWELWFTTVAAVKRLRANTTIWKQIFQSKVWCYLLSVLSLHTFSFRKTATAEQSTLWHLTTGRRVPPSVTVHTDTQNLSLNQILCIMKKINKHKNKCQNPNLKKKEKSLNMDQNNAAEDPSLLSCARTLIVS